MRFAAAGPLGAQQYRPEPAGQNADKNAALRLKWASLLGEPPTKLDDAEGMASWLDEVISTYESGGEPRSGRLVSSSRQADNADRHDRNDTHASNDGPLYDDVRVEYFPGTDTAAFPVGARPSQPSKDKTQKIIALPDSSYGEENLLGSRNWNNEAKKETGVKE